MKVSRVSGVEGGGCVLPGVALVGLVLAASGCAREPSPALPSAPSSVAAIASTKIASTGAPAAPLPGAPTEPNGALFRVGTPRYPLGTPPRRLAFSSDGKRLAGCGIHGLVAIWDVVTGHALARPSMGGWNCDAIAWTAGDAGVAVAGSGFTSSTTAVSTFDAGTSARLATLTLPSEVIALGPGSGSGLWIAARDGARVWAPGEAKPPLLALDGPWGDGEAVQRGELFAYGDYRTGVVVRSIAKKPSICKLAADPEAMALSADGALLAIALKYGGGVQRVALPGCTVVDTQPNVRVRALSFTGDGALLGVAGEDVSWAIHRWPAPSGAAASTTVARVPRFDSEKVALSPDGRWIAVGRATGAEVFDAATGKPLFEATHREQINAVSVWNDGTVITASDDAALRVRDQGKTATRFEVGNRGSAIDAAGTRIARTVKDGTEATLEVLDLAAGTARPFGDRSVDEVFTWAGPNLLVRRNRGVVALDPKGAVVSTGSLGQHDRPFASEDGATIVAAVDGTLVNRLRVEVRGAIVTDAEDDERTSHVTGMAIDTGRLVVVRHKKTGTRHEIERCDAHTYSLPGLAATIDSFKAAHAVGERIADVSAVTLAKGAAPRFFVGYQDGRIGVLGAGAAAMFTSGAGWVTALDVSPDGKLLVSAHADGAVFVWRIGAP